MTRKGARAARPRTALAGRSRRAEAFRLPISLARSLRLALVLRAHPLALAPLDLDLDRDRDIFLHLEWDLEDLVDREDGLLAIALGRLGLGDPVVELLERLRDAAAD